MVKKILTLVSVTALTGIVSAAGAVGCSSEDDPAAPAADGGKDGGKVKTDAGGPVDDDAGPGSCYDEGTANVLSDKVTAEFPGGKCTAQEVKDVVAACFGEAGTKEDCEAFQKDHANCFSCVLGPTGSPATFDLPAFLSLESTGLISVNACLAVALGEPECAIPLTNQVFCAYTACESCAEEESDACIEEALTTGVCSQIELSAACKAVGQTEDEAALAKCTGADGLKTLSATINTLCNVGNGGGDGG